MRKWLRIGSLTVALCSLGGYFYLSRENPGSDPDWGIVENEIKPRDGETEPSDEFEPLFVGIGTPTLRPMAPAKDDGPMARVELEAGGLQPPRPDEEPGHAPRMPYADD